MWEYLTPFSGFSGADGAAPLLKSLRTFMLHECSLQNELLNRPCVWTKVKIELLVTKYTQKCTEDENNRSCDLIPSLRKQVLSQSCGIFMGYVDKIKSKTMLILYIRAGWYSWIINNVS